MQIKKYTAKNVQEALRKVKKELGPEALIVSVNNVKASSGLQALLSQARVEVTAAIDEISPEHRYIRKRAPSVDIYSPPKPDQSLHPRSLPDFQKVTHGARHLAQTMRQTLSSWRVKTNTSHNKRTNDRVVSLGRMLTDIGIQKDIIKQIIDVLLQEVPSPETSYDTFRMEGLTKDILQQLVKTSGPFELAGQKPKYIALVGPTGCGKTTTIAKLSAETLLKKKKKVGLITIDTYRIGAMEQLNTYAGIMNIPVKLASTFEQMQKALLQYQNQDVVFIDTAGFSHHDREHLHLINAFLAQVSNPEVHLVVSVNTNEKELIHISEKFNTLHYGHLLFTKLDESSYPGAIFNHMVYTGKPISYITTGQKVPEDIELATPATIIQKMFQKRHIYDAPKLR
jgi:flagellar biosynthesis protein FlhF